MSDAKQFIVGGIPVSVKDEVARESIGDLSELTTTNKSNLVEAINEAAQSGSGEGSDPEAVKYTSQSLTTSQKNQARTNIGAGTYSKPSGGIPSSDLASGVIPDVSGKQDVIQDLSTIRSGAASGATAYQKPGTGIPASDLASGVIPTVPTISTNISTDSASDAKTASPKAVKTYVDGIASEIAGNINGINENIDDINGDIEDLGITIETIGNGAFVVAWDGEDTPVAANIPAGVSVTYDGDSYTGSLDASSSTVGKIYLVATGTSGNYDRHVTVGDSTYSWVHIGTTSVALEEYATNSKISQLEAKLPMLGGYLVPLLRKVVYKDDDAESLIAGINALLNTVEVTSISAVYTQPGTIYAGQPLDDLKANLVVYANYNDGSSVEVSTYELSGTLTAGTSSILVTYQEFTTTFNVTVTDAVHYKDGSIFPGGVSLRNSATSANLSQAYTYNGVTYVFTNGSSTTAAKRCSYYLFDLLLTAGKTYRFTIEFYSSLTSAQSIIPSIGYYDEAYRAAGVANVYAAFDYTSHLTDPGWLTSTKVDSKTVQWEHLTPEGVVGGRISIKLQSSGTDQTWPSTLNVKRLIIQEVTE